MLRWDVSYDEVKVGYVWAMHGPELVKVYPPFVNGYDNAKEFLDRCMEEIPKFLSFVKAAESDPRCRKITLKDMLIKPVQRLPSVILLLKGMPVSIKNYFQLLYFFRNSKTYQQIS